MKILYAIQGTGNGHVSRAQEIIPLLKKYGQLGVLISGGIEHQNLPFATQYRFHGLGFVFGKRGGIDFWQTIKEINLRKVFREIQSLPIHDYDLIINDFEPISAWAAKINNVPVIALSHQAAILNPLSPTPKNINVFERMLLKYYAPSHHQYGFHFQPYNKLIFTPVIRKEIRKLEVCKKGHYTVYLPAYSDQKIIDILSEFPSIHWQVFSKHTNETYLINNILITPINNEKFINSLVSCRGVLCGAGFETPAEALYLKKKLMVIPMKAQFEQQCNAKALKEMGVPVIQKLSKKSSIEIKKWLQDERIIRVDYPNITDQIIEAILSLYTKMPNGQIALDPLPFNDV